MRSPIGKVGSPFGPWPESVVVSPGWHLLASLLPSCPPSSHVSLLHRLCPNSKASSVLPLKLDSLDVHPSSTYYWLCVLTSLLSLSVFHFSFIN